MDTMFLTEALARMVVDGTLDLSGNTARLPEQWPAGIKSLDLSGNTARLPEQCPAGVRIFK